METKICPEPVVLLDLGVGVLVQRVDLTSRGPVV